MTYRWFRWWMLLSVPLILSPFVIAGMLFVEAYTDAPERMLGSIPVFIFSLLLAYSSLAYLLNSTRVCIENELVTVRHGPIPWPGTVVVMAECEKFLADKIYESRFPADGVRVRFEDGHHETLTYTANAQQAQDWANQLNSHLQFAVKTSRVAVEGQSNLKSSND